MKVDQNVVFTTVDGEKVVAIVEHIWQRPDSNTSPPLINLRERQTATSRSSVPHVSDVPGATGYFYE